jgi:hypothetical protein
MKKRRMTQEKSQFSKCLQETLNALQDQKTNLPPLE